MNILRIKADIQTAYNNIDPLINTTNDGYLIDIAAFHTQQAIEKSLKYFLHNIYGVDEEDRNYKIHSISQLIAFISKFDDKFVDNHKDLLPLTLELNAWEAQTRYNFDVCSDIDKIKEYLKIADRLYHEVLEIENERIAYLSEKCFVDPYCIRDITFEEQTQEIVESTVKGCENIQGLNPMDLREYIADKFLPIVDNFPGHWAPAPPDNKLVWTM